jgi:hypothetical protein
MKKGDLVLWKSIDSRVKDYGVVLDVCDHRGIFPEEVFVKFPLDGVEGWYLSRNLEKLEETNESGGSPESLSQGHGI